MSKPPSTKPPKRSSSGEHVAVQAYREKLESIQDSTLEQLRDLNKKLEEEIESRTKDPRRDGDSDPPVDVLPPSGRRTLPVPRPTPKRES